MTLGLHPKSFSGWSLAQFSQTFFLRKVGKWKQYHRLLAISARKKAGNPSIEHPL